MKNRRNSAASLMLTFCLSAFGCTSCDEDFGPVPGPCDSPLLTNVVPAGSIGEAAGISEYVYRADIDARGMEIDLNTGNTVGGTLHVEQLGDAAADAAGAMQARLGNVTLTTRGGRTLDEKRLVDMVVQRDDEVLHIRAALAPRPCFPDGAGPVCTGLLDVSRAPVLLPSCGLDYDDQLQFGTAMVLTDLRYAATGDGTPPGIGGEVVDGETRAIVDVMTNGTPRDMDAVSADIAAVGGAMARLVEDGSVRLLAAAYLDPVWRRALQLHAAHCLSSNAFSLDETAEESEALTGGDNASRDTSSWGGADKTGGAGFWGDPHMTTFDGVDYDFQAAGDFLLARSSPSGLPALEVQSRFVPLSGGPPVCRHVTVGASNVVVYDGHVYEVSASGVLVDGAAADIGALPAGVSIGTSSMELVTSDGTEIEISGGRRVRILPSAERVGTFVGLLGDADGRGDNDFRPGADAAAWARPVPFDMLYGAFRDAWRLDAATSYFTYAAGEGPDDFYDEAIPGEAARLDLIEDAVRTAAEATCRARGLDAKGALFDCVLDVICLGEAGDIPSDAGAAERDGDGVTLTGDIALAPRPETFDPGQPYADPSRETCAFAEAPVMVLFDEGEHVLDAPLVVDQAGPGAAPPSTPPPDIPAGQRVHTYLVHLAPGTTGTASVRATLRFASPVRALQFADDTVRDERFVPEGQSVVDAPERGVRWADGAEVTLTGDARQVNVNWPLAPDAEQMRIILEVTP